ncbi:hypothetical protein Scep_006386 [Stephania cephalantha]|uniref:Uncharacterized protein n=1 Tax=Stephania cephalantha TaxID=152367 RepID=A0AAP0K9F9_9MAGN
MLNAEQVIEKLKDDGDFDNLRLKIIRKLKENEELRNSIISEVKQSAAIDRAGAENLKPRQLSDAIHEEIGNKVMSQISDALWQVIRSNDGMQSEIRETVESVYNTLLNPRGKDVDEVEPYPGDEPKPVQNEALSSSPATSPCERENSPSSSEPKQPPGFSDDNCLQPNNGQEEHREETKVTMDHDQECGAEMEYEPNTREMSPSDASLPPGFSASVNNPQLCDGSDDDDADPDVPPGFG